MRSSRSTSSFLTFSVFLFSTFPLSFFTSTSPSVSLFTQAHYRTPKRQRSRIITPEVVGFKLEIAFRHIYKHFGYHRRVRRARTSPTVVRRPTPERRLPRRWAGGCPPAMLQRWAKYWAAWGHRVSRRICEERATDTALYTAPNTCTTETHYFMILTLVK